MGLSLQTGLGTRDNSSMSLGYAPERRKVLALQVETPAANGLIIPSTRDLAHEKGRQSALSVPESVRALGEPLEPLFEACGGRQTLSLSVRRRDGAAPPETYEFQQPFILIGRCQQSDLPLNDAKVNFRHIYLQLVDGRWLFVDLGLLSGSAAGERGRSASGWFDPASELVVGPYVITHVALETTMLARRDNQSSKLPADLPAVYLEFINGLGSSRNRQSRRVLGPVTLLGSSRQCDLWLRDESVSKVHASLVLTREGLWVVDLLGREGVQIDERPAYWKRVHDGSLVTIGRFHFRVRFGSADAPPVSGARRVREPEVVRKATGRKSSRGSVSEDSVLAMFHHMTEMQNQFFEQSQVQMQLMAQMLAHLGRSQQESVRKDLSRIDEIGRELDGIRSQLAQEPKSDTSQDQKGGKSGKKRNRKAQKPGGQQLLIDVPDQPRGTLSPTDAPTIVSGQVQGKSRPPQATPPSETPPRRDDSSDADRNTIEPAVDSPSEFGIPAGRAEAHARLTKRMARLAQERNSAWHRVLSAFGRKSE